jgi:hypothetical protein
LRAVSLLLDLVASGIGKRDSGVIGTLC